MSCLPLFAFHLSLSGEWLSTAIGIAVTYAVFVMGVPALISQTFIPEALRNIYKERLMQGWHRFFLVQMALIIVMLCLSNPMVCGIESEPTATNGTNIKPNVAVSAPKFPPEPEMMAMLTILIVVIVLGLGHYHLVKNFNASQYIGERLSKKIVDKALSSFRQNQEILKKEIDDLSLLARELSPGAVKNAFLEQCERLVETMPKLGHSIQSADKMIAEVLEKAVCPCITSDGIKANADNMRKALEILTMVYSQAKIREGSISETNYLNTIVGNCIKEIGVKAVSAKDLPVVMLAIGKLSSIEGTSRDMFYLGDAALQQGYTEAAVIMIRKLGDRVRNHISVQGHILGFKDKRTYAWVGLVSRLYQKEGHAQKYAERQIENVIEQRGINIEETRLLFKNAPLYFYQRADFTTADAILALQQKRYPT